MALSYATKKKAEEQDMNAFGTLPAPARGCRRPQPDRRDRLLRCLRWRQSRQPVGAASWVNFAANLGIVAIPVGLLMIAGETRHLDRRDDPGGLHDDRDHLRLLRAADLASAWSGALGLGVLVGLINGFLVSTHLGAIADHHARHARRDAGLVLAGFGAPHRNGQRCRSTGAGTGQSSCSASSSAAASRSSSSGGSRSTAISAFVVH